MFSHSSALGKLTGLVFEKKKKTVKHYSERNLVKRV